MNQRFTLDGSDALEQFLADFCQRIACEIRQIVPSQTLQALVLGGGYGRGEGGVLRIENGDLPYNDLEFYVFLRGNHALNERSFGKRFHALGARLSPEAGLHVEFKIDSLDKFRHRPISTFSYDLVSGHKIIFGNANVFHDCGYHADSRAIPLSEATRLLLNRCSGLLLVRELLCRSSLSPEDADFIGRNLAKAQLALGDAVLLAFGAYDWSCLTRGNRLQKLELRDPVPQLPVIRRHHVAGVQFKLHPRRASETVSEFTAIHHELCSLAAQLWLWLEQRRLSRTFRTIKDYALDCSRKCPETSLWRNVLLNMRAFGLRALLSRMAGRYPRERLFNSLPLLLWNGEISREPEICHHLQKQLQTTATDRAGLLAAYQQVWPSYG